MNEVTILYTSYLCNKEFEANGGHDGHVWNVHFRNTEHLMSDVYDKLFNTVLYKEHVPIS